MYLELHQIRYSQDSIGSTFQGGRDLDELINALRRNPNYYENNCQKIRVVREWVGNQLVTFSLDNRRLFCLKEALPNNFTITVNVCDDDDAMDELRRKSHYQFKQPGFGKYVDVRGWDSDSNEEGYTDEDEEENEYDY